MLNGVGSIQFTGGTILINQPETGLADHRAARSTARRGARSAAARDRPGRSERPSRVQRRLPARRPDGRVLLRVQRRRPDLPEVRCRRAGCCSSGISRARKWTTTCAGCRRPGRRAGPTGDVLPVVPPAVRAAGVDRQGRLWVALSSPFTYVYDGSGDKLRTFQFKGADILTPNSLFFTKDGRDPGDARLLRIPVPADSRSSPGRIRAQRSAILQLPPSGAMISLWPKRRPFAARKSPRARSG